MNSFLNPRFSEEQLTLNCYKGYTFQRSDLRPAVGQRKKSGTELLTKDNIFNRIFDMSSGVHF